MSASKSDFDPQRKIKSPIELEGLRSKPQETVSAGLPAVTAALKISFEQMGPLRTFETLSHLNQVDGFDCPGCAWPDPDPEHRSLNEYCENGAKSIAEEATTRRVTPEFFGEWSVNQLSQQPDYWLSQQGRLTHPMVLRDGETHYQPISWQESFNLIGAELNSLTSPNQAVFYTSGRTSNEAAFLYQLFVRQYGTNNLPDCSNMCHESSGAALMESIGIGKGTVTLDDIEHADVIFVIGQNPGTCHPRMLTALECAVINGATVVSVNPLEEAGLMRFKHPQHPLAMLGKGTQLAKLHLPVRINGDIALFKGIMKEMLEREERVPGTVIDRAFIDSRTEGFAKFAREIATAGWDDIVEQSGISRHQIKLASDIAVRSKATICTWAMGLTQHKNAVAQIQEIANFLLLRGMFGKKGAGACPVRGHSNVQGDRTVGIYEKPPKHFLDRLAKAFDFDPPRENGFDTVDAIRAMHDGRAEVFIAMGGNFLSATPDTAFTAQALSNCRLTVQISTKLNRSHLITGRQALILPCLGRTEIDRQKTGAQFVSVENSMGIVHKSQGNLVPASDSLLSEPAIVAGIAKATNLRASNIPDWDALVGNYDRIREKIEQVVEGFEDYNQRVRAKGGFYLPNGPREGKFPTESGKAKFFTHPLTTHRLRADEYMMMTIRSHDQFNTTIYALDDRYRGISHGRRVIFMNADDVSLRGWKKGALVDIASHHRGKERKVERFYVVPYKIPRQCVAAYFPETNPLVAIDHTADISQTPASKSVVVTLEASAQKPS